MNISLKSKKNVTFRLFHLKGASVMTPKLKKAASLGHASSVLVESENFRITEKNAIKSKCLHEKIKYVYLQVFVKTYNSYIYKLNIVFQVNIFEYIFLHLKHHGHNLSK
jgi:hypothetical protein